MALKLPRLPRNVAITEAMGAVTIQFQRWWQSVVEALERQEQTQDQLIADLTTTQDNLTDLITDITGLQTDLTGFVQKDQTPAWADPTGTLTRTTFAAYAGQTVSSPPTQAEVQAIDNALKANSERLAALIKDLRDNGALT
jgi:hypothetical protein